MRNPGIDFEIWKGLRRKWTGLDARGHKVRVDFQLIAHPNKKEDVLAIDVVQHIDGKPVTETVQRQASEAYAPLGIAGLSLENLVEVYKEMLAQLGKQSGLRDAPQKPDVVVTMSPTSETSGELTGLLVRPDAPVQSPVQVNYQHYYVLNALRERMSEVLGERWSQVRATYHDGNVEFHFEY